MRVLGSALYVPDDLDSDARIVLGYDPPRNNNPMGSYKGHRTQATAGVHTLFTPSGTKTFTGVGAREQMHNYVDTVLAGPVKRNSGQLHLPMKANKRFVVGDKRDYPKIGLSIDGKYSVTTWFPTVKLAVEHFRARYPGSHIQGWKERKNGGQRRVWRVAFSHVEGPLHEKRLRAMGDYVATFAARDDADAAVRQAGANGFGGQVREGIVKRKNGQSLRMNPAKAAPVGFDIYKPGAKWPAKYVILAGSHLAFYSNLYEALGFALQMAQWSGQATVGMKPKDKSGGFEIIQQFDGKSAPLNPGGLANLSRFRNPKAPTLKQLKHAFPNYDSTKSAEYEAVWAYLRGLNLPRDVADKLTDSFNLQMWKKAGHHKTEPAVGEFEVNINPRRKNHHIAVGTPVLAHGHIARVVKQHPKDYYTIKYVDTGALQTVRGSTLNKK